MSEPTVATLATSTALGTATATTALLPGIDGNALVGAVAGAALFVTSSRDLPLVRRVIYLVISTVVGYLAAPEVAARMGLQETGVSAFLAAAFAIAITVQGLERIKTLDLARWLRRGGS